jgi:hypothetical protein
MNSFAFGNDLLLRKSGNEERDESIPSFLLSSADQGYVSGLSAP